MFTIISNRHEDSIANCDDLYMARMVAGALNATRIEDEAYEIDGVPYLLYWVRDKDGKEY